MEITYPIGDTIKALRRQRNISQEVLADALGVSIQAVSKWETGASLPDILMLPGVAQFFGVTIDSLFTGEPQQAEISMPLLPDDGCLRLVQFLGRRFLNRELVDPARPIPLDVTHLPRDQVWNVEIWGSADIKGRVGGNVHAGNSVECRAVGGSVHAGDGVACGNVSGGVSSGGEVKCGDIGGSVDAQGDIHCNNIFHAEHISCENIVCKEGHIHCNNMNQD